MVYAAYWRFFLVIISYAGSLIAYLGTVLWKLTATYSDASISLFRFRYNIDAILTKYHDIDVLINIK